MKVLESKHRRRMAATFLSGSFLFAWACSTYTSSSGDDAGSNQPALDGKADTCDAPRTKCATACVDTRTDNGNCGACGMACASGQQCTGGICELVCPPEFTICKPSVIASDAGSDASPDASADAANDATPPSDIDGGPAAPYCAKLTNDTSNCGSCGNQCGASLVCTTGVCCKAEQAVCSGACTLLANDSSNCGACGKACTGATPSCNGGVCTARYTTSGVQQNVAVATASSGWQECFKEAYGSTTPLAAIQANCSRAQIMMACRQTNAASLSVLAQAPRNDVFFNTGDGINATHNANGVSWYWSDNRSVGFAPSGAGVERNDCDFIDSYGGSPQENVGQGDKRMCIHTSGGSTNSGFRCGKANFLSTGWERIFYHAN